MKRWIMSSYLDLQVWGRRPWPLLLLTNWVSISSRRLVQSLKKAGDLVAILNDLEPGDVPLLMRFIACLCRWKRCFIVRWEDFYIDIMIGAGEGSRSVHLELPPFTFDWCDDSGWYASNPLRARFGITGHMEYYAHADLTEIVERTADIFEMEITMRQHLSWPCVVVEPLVLPIVSLKRVRDFAQIMGMA